MPRAFQIPDEDLQKLENVNGLAAEKQLKAFRYVVASVNQDALDTWSELWNELKNGVTPAGAVMPDMQEGFKPSCGWGEFMEKFWLMKHYLDYIQRFSRG